MLLQTFQKHHLKVSESLFVSVTVATNLFSPRSKHYKLANKLTLAPVFKYAKFPTHLVSSRWSKLRNGNFTSCYTCVGRLFITLITWVFDVVTSNKSIKLFFLWIKVWSMENCSQVFELKVLVMDSCCAFQKGQIDDFIRHLSYGKMLHILTK